MAHEEGENNRRFVTGIAAFAATIAETVGNWSESTAKTGSRYALRLEKTLGRWLRGGGRILGLAAGIVMAVWDGIRGWQELQEGNGVGWLYFLSAGMSLTGALAFSWLGPLIFGSAATGVGIVLIVLVVMVAVLIEVFKDNKIQDWMERCYFGDFDVAERYQDPERELNELRMATGGMEG